MLQEMVQTAVKRTMRHTKEAKIVFVLKVMAPNTPAAGPELSDRSNT